MTEERPYQTRAVNFLAGDPGAPRRRGLVWAPAGSGKTIIGAKALARVARDGWRIVWLANTREQVEQAEAALGRVEFVADVTATVCCVAANPDTARCDVLIVDECFPAGTKVSGRAIETLRPGDFVESYDHSGNRIVWRKIVRTMRTRPRGDMVRLTTRKNRILYSTANHPFYVEGRGYVAAADLRHNETLYTSRNLLLEMPPPATCTALGDEDCSRSLPRGEEGILLPRMLESSRGGSFLKNGGGDKPQVRVGADEVQKPNVQGELQAKSLAYFAEDGAQAEDSGRQRACAHQTATHAVPLSRRRVGNGVRRADAAQSVWVPNLLQDRPCEAGRDDCDRSGRVFSLRAAGTQSRPKENSLFGVDWVDRVEVLQSTDRELTPDGFVYNLEVEEHHNYFAEGVLVHNCHHMPAETWEATVERAANAGAIIWGLTATPWHDSDPERNAKMKEVFGEVFQIEREEIIASGHLVEGKVFVHDLDFPGQFDAEIGQHVKAQLGFRVRRFPMVPAWEHERRIRNQVTQEFIQANENRNACATSIAIQEAARGESVLMLVFSIEHGERLVERMPGSAICHSKLGKKLRRQLIEQFRSGEMKILVATSLADEGLDVPRASRLVLVAGGRSSTKLEQRAGRVLRPHADKSGGIIHDFLDRGAAFAWAQSRARFKIYDRLGYSPEIVTPENYGKIAA